MKNLSQKKTALPLSRRQIYPLLKDYKKTLFFLKHGIMLGQRKGRKNGTKRETLYLILVF